MVWWVLSAWSLLRSILHVESTWHVHHSSHLLEGNLSEHTLSTYTLGLWESTVLLLLSVLLTHSSSIVELTLTSHSSVHLLLHHLHLLHHWVHLSLGESLLSLSLLPTNHHWSSWLRSHWLAWLLLLWLTWLTRLRLLWLLLVHLLYLNDKLFTLYRFDISSLYCNLLFTLLLVPPSTLIAK